MGHDSTHARKAIIRNCKDAARQHMQVKFGGVISIVVMFLISGQIIIYYEDIYLEIKCVQHKGKHFITGSCLQLHIKM